MELVSLAVSCLPIRFLACRWLCRWTEQDESLVTHAAKISKREMRLIRRWRRLIACVMCSLRPIPHPLVA